MGARLDRASEATQGMKQRVANAKVATEAVATVMRKLELEVVRLEEELKQRGKDEEGDDDKSTGSTKGWLRRAPGGNNSSAGAEGSSRPGGSKRGNGSLKDDAIATQANVEALDSPVSAWRGFFLMIAFNNIPLCALSLAVRVSPQSLVA